MLILKNYPNNCSQRSEYYEANDQTFSISGFNIVLERHYEKYLWVEIVKQKIWDQDEGFVNSIQVHLLPPICTLRYHIMGQLSHSSWGENILLKTSKKWNTARWCRGGWPCLWLFSSCWSTSSTMWQTCRQTQRAWRQSHPGCWVGHIEGICSKYCSQSQQIMFTIPGNNVHNSRK